MTSKNCFKIAARGVRLENSGIAKDTIFLGAPVDEASVLIENSRKDADDFFVLTLWVIFERFIIDYVRNKCEKLKDIAPQEIGANLHSKLEREIEFWRIDDILDLLKGPLNGMLIGNAKQIKDYRDWIAHRNERRPTPVKVTPKSAYDILSSIVQQIENIDACFTDGDR